jgi:hypothetical protein
MVYLDGEVPGEVKASDEWTVVHEKGTQEVFGAKGDSGSVIVDKTGEFLGLLFAGPNSSNWVYMTPYEVLVSDIEQATGAKFFL